MPGALEGMRVIDLTQMLAGPLCAMNLADHGADVIKVEPPQGEDLRSVPPIVEGESAAFMMWNRNKRSITLNLKDPADHATLLDLIAEADVLLESYRPGVMARLGLDWDSLNERFPRLIYGSVSGYGQTGPYSKRGGFDVMAQGISGLMSITGPRDGPPHRLPIPICDLAAGLNLTIGVLAAVEARHRTGRGQYVETSLLEAAVALQVYEAVHYFTAGTNPPRMGQAHRGIAPYQVFPSADGYVTIGAGMQRFFEMFCRLAEAPELLTDPRFATVPDRVAHNDALIELLSEATRKHTTEWWVRELDGLGIPCGPVLNHEQLFNHPQIVHRRMVETVEHPKAGQVKTLGVPIKLSETPGSIRFGAPLLGQHAKEIIGKRHECRAGGNMQAVQDPVVPDFVKKLQRIDTYDEIKEIITSPDFMMAGAEERTIFLEDTLIMSEGQRHSELKQLFAPLMSRQAMAYYELHLVEPVIQDVIREMKGRRDADGNVRLDAVALIQAALTRISARVTGVDGVDTPERTERFRQLVLILSEATTGSFSKTPQAEMIRKGKEAMVALVEEYLQASLDRRIELARKHRAGEIDMTDLPRDMLMSLCRKDDLSRPDDGEKIPYVWRQCALFLTGSIKTTSHSLPHVFFHVDEWIKEHPEDREKLTDVEFLHKAAAESFRLHQTSPARFRAAIRDVTLSTGRKVAKGEMVALHAPPANVQAEVFGEDARYFNPYREVPKGMQPWGMTFGLGVHSCLGRNLVTGIQNKGDEKHGTHGTAVRVMKALYDLGAELDPENPPKRQADTLHDQFESMPMILRNL
jgi:CoA:oxalate CoA-transferase